MSQRQAIQTVCDLTGRVKPDGEAGWVRLPKPIQDVSPEAAGKTLTESATVIQASIDAANAARIKAQQDAQQARRDAIAAQQAARQPKPAPAAPVAGNPSATPPSNT